MRRFGMILAVALMAVAPGGAAFAQQVTAQQVAVMQGDAPGEYRALGVVSAEVHQKSIFPKTPVQQQLDDALRAEAAKLGADAVIQVTYRMSNALTSKDGHHATGVAVKFSRPTQMATAPAATPSPAPEQHAAAAPTAASPPPAVFTQPVAPALAAGPSFSATAPPIAITTPPPAPVAARHATTPAMILLTEQDLAGQRYVRLGEVSAVTHQKSMFPKTPPLETLKSALQGEAAKLGADAVIQVKYSMSNALTSKDGHKAVGVAVRFE